MNQDIQYTPFAAFAKLVRERYEAILALGHPVVVMNIDKRELYQKYLDAFPAGTNVMFRERREYDCNCCKHFIYNIGNIGVITPEGAILTIWDVEAEGYYATVTAEMSRLVRAVGATYEPYVSELNVVGSEPNVDNYSERVWSHFMAKVPSNFIHNSRSESVAEFKGRVRTDMQLLQKGLTEFTTEALEQAIELASSGNLYRGQEFVAGARAFLAAYTELNLVLNQPLIYLYRMLVAAKNVQVARFPNSVFGTFVADLSDGMGLEQAVARFEAKVAPTNYRRTTAVVTPRMMEEARKSLTAAGVLSSLERRIATVAELPVSEMLFVRTPDAPSVDLFAAAIQHCEVTAPTSGIPITLNKLMREVLPASAKAEVFFTPSLVSRLIAMTTAVHADSPTMFKWNNHAAWAYNGDVTDHIRERVKAAGGSVDGELVISLAWHCADDLDLSLRRGYNAIYFGNRREWGGELDVDMNAGGRNDSENPVENISFQSLKHIPNGDYTVCVNNYNTKSSKTNAHTVRIQIGSEVQELSYTKNLGSDQTKTACVINVHNGVAKFVSTSDDYTSAGGSLKSEEVWGLMTNTYVPITAATPSPNQWGNNSIGQQHLFLLLEGCRTPTPVRGFFNEYLTPSLSQHSKAIELLGSIAQAQLGSGNEPEASGIGFSYTDNYNFFVRINGSKVYQVISEEL